VGRGRGLSPGGKKVWNGGKSKSGTGSLELEGDGVEQASDLSFTSRESRVEVAAAGVGGYDKNVCVLERREN